MRATEILKSAPSPSNSKYIINTNIHVFKYANMQILKISKNRYDFSSLAVRRVNSKIIFHSILLRTHKLQ